MENESVEPVKHTRADKYWFYIYVEVCVLCGYTVELREKRYTKKPEKYEDRHEFKDFACGHHFN